MGRHYKINLKRLKSKLVLAGGNVTEASRLHGGISVQGARNAIRAENSLKEFRKAGVQGLRMGVQNPYFKKLVKKEPGLRRDLALQETIQHLIAMKKMNKAAKSMGLDPSGIHTRLRAIGGVKTILGKEKISKTKTTTKIFDPKLSRLAGKYPDLTRSLAILDTIWQNKKTGDRKKTAAAFSLKRVTVHKRLAHSAEAISQLRAGLPNKTLRELKLR